MSEKVIEAGIPINFTGTNTAVTGKGALIGIFVASSSSGTIKLQDGTKTIVNTFSVTAGQFYCIPARFSASLVITVGGTLDATAFIHSNG